jgi:hypothetical protein
MWGPRQAAPAHTHLAAAGLAEVHLLLGRCCRCRPDLLHDDVQEAAHRQQAGANLTSEHDLRGMWHVSI